MSLAQHIRKKNWTALEEAWTELTLGTADPGSALEALRIAADTREIARCIPMVKDHAQMLVDKERAAEGAELLGRAMVLGGSPGELAAPLFNAAEKAWCDEEEWAPFVEMAGLEASVADMRSAWKRFRKLMSLTPGRVVYHPQGWGLATIESRDLDEREIHLRFATGRTDRFPFTTCLDIFEVLEPEDLRALVILDPEGLQKMLRNEPLEVLRWVCQRNKNRVNHGGLKLSMGTLGVDGARFTTWWRKTRKQAETSAWFELAGSATRVQVRLLDVASDPVEAFRRQMHRTRSLREALQRVRDVVGGTEQDADLASAALETIDELASEDSGPLTNRLSVWLYLREERKATPAPLAELLAERSAEPEPSDPSQTPALWSLFHEVSSAREQERCIELLQEVHGETWLDEAARHLQHSAMGMARGLVDALADAGRDEELSRHYAALLARSTRNPALLVRLAERIEKRGGDETILPPPLQRVQCLLQLAVHLHRSSRGNSDLTRVRTRLTSVLTNGAPSILARLLEPANLDDYRRLASMLEAGVETGVDRAFTRIAVDFSADVFRGDERPFWESGGIWTTRAGLTAREDELRELRDVKIPANAEAIGKAASYGDLSENSEWEAAIEEQRTLTSRAMELENDLRDAMLIEEAPIPEGVAAPGTLVRFRDPNTSEESRSRLLGPWDVNADDVISYRSPLGAGLLGMRVGDVTTVKLPQGERSVELLSVEPLPLT